MEHGDWLELVSAKADGELTAPESAALAGHLDGCALCRERLNRFETERRRARMHEPSSHAQLLGGILAARDRTHRAAAGKKAVLARRVALGAAVAAAAAVAALILVPGDSGPKPDLSSRHIADTRISAADRKFDRPDIQVDAGATVEWRNTSTSRHRLVRELGAVTVDQELPPGGTEAATFDEPGIFAYYCEVHPAMSGTVTVMG
jgi:plastocyanin